MSHAFKILTLDRQPEKWRAFLANNPMLAGATRVSAIDGLHVPRAQFLQDGLITADNVYSSGALGCAASHTGLWRDVRETGRAVTVIEDDAIVHPMFADAVEAALRRDAWDIVLWGWNLNWPASVFPTPGFPMTTLKSVESAPRFDAASFRQSTFHANLMRIHSAAGTLCYSISAQGAERLLSLCLPLGATPAPYPHVPRTLWANDGLDVELSRHYAAIAAYCCYPPLAFSHNEWDQSAVRPNKENREHGKNPV